MSEPIQVLTYLGNPLAQLKGRHQVLDRRVMTRNTSSLGQIPTDQVETLCGVKRLVDKNGPNLVWNTDSVKGIVIRLLDPK